jgi:hypothetical protein
LDFDPIRRDQLKIQLLFEHDLFPKTGFFHHVQSGRGSSARARLRSLNRPRDTFAQDDKQARQLDRLSSTGFW